MSQFTCGPNAHVRAKTELPQTLVSVLGSESEQFPQYIGKSISRASRHLNINPSAQCWDALAICLSVAAVDLAADRSKSPDGWTRELHVKIGVSDPVNWARNVHTLVEAVSFLTGDRWSIEFEQSSSYKPRHASSQNDASCVALLSGGMDSLVGHLDLVAAGQIPFAVSHVYRGDRDAQSEFKQAINPVGSHLLVGQAERLISKPSPPSQRGRSMTFFGLGILAATSLHCYSDNGRPVSLCVPENGFISLNPPLTSARVGSHSTRTTHPRFLSGLQQYLNLSGINISIDNPYQHMTKGEMLASCSNPTLLRQLIGRSISCGRYRVNNRTHCGRCVPCLVRRSAFHKAGIPDPTRYSLIDLRAHAQTNSIYTDVRDAIIAIREIRISGSSRRIVPYLPVHLLGQHGQYSAVATRGLEEIASMLGI